MADDLCAACYSSRPRRIAGHYSRISEIEGNKLTVEFEKAGQTALVKQFDR